MKPTLQNLQQEIDAIKVRNKKVEANKAWETSWFRRFLVIGLTYIVMVIFMMVAQFDRPFVGAIIPAIAYLISVSTLSIFKNWWTHGFNKKGFINVGFMLSMIFVFPFASSIIIQQQSNSQIYEHIDQLPNAESAFILGAAAYGNRLSGVLEDRMDRGIELYNNQKVNQIIVSGAPNEVKAMKNYAVDKGVDEKDITMDPDGLNTYLSFANYKDKKDLIIVTQKFHLPRSVFIADSFNINAVGYIADNGDYEKIFEFKKRELLASSKAMLMAVAGKRK